VLSVADGAEVEILARRSGGPGRARYQAHSIRDRREGWLAVEKLCAVRRVVTGAEPPWVSPRTAPRAKPKDSGRKEGKESGTFW